MLKWSDRTAEIFTGDRIRRDDATGTVRGFENIPGVSRRALVAWDSGEEPEYVELHRLSKVGVRGR